jgi:RNA polymerase sigma-70 factor (ECF subfamily)
MSDSAKDPMQTRIDLPRPKVPRASEIPATRWTLVGRAESAQPADARAALDELLRLYLPAMRAHLLARTHMSPERADDVLQAFITDKVLAKHLLASADRTRGRFRTFLLTALDRFAIDRMRVEGAAKRSPEAQGKHMMDVDDEATPQPTSPIGDPSIEFDRAWARQTVAEATRRMRDECTANNRMDLWGVFEARLLLPATDGRPAVPHEELAKLHGFPSASHASNALGTAKQMFARHLRAVVGAYTTGPLELDQEISDLWQIFSRRQA